MHKYMHIERVGLGFVQSYPHPTIQKIHFQFDGSCTITMHDGSTRQLTIPCDGFHSQYGIPASMDGTMLFRGSWEKGLDALDAFTGKKIWHYNPGRIRDIYVYPTYLIVARAYSAVLKMDLQTGQVLQSITSPSIDDVFHLDERRVFVDIYRGKWRVVDVETMEIVKSYVPRMLPKKDAPRLGLVVRDAYIENGQLILDVLETYPNEETAPCIRVLDEHYAEEFGNAE